jgi:hypothetical protein
MQSMVERRAMGAATSTVQFARSLGGALGVGVMGAVFNWRERGAGFEAALAAAFWVAAIATAFGFLTMLAAPRLTVEELRRRRA